MGKIVVRNAVKKEPGKLYYVDGDGNVCEADFNRNGRRGNKKKPGK